MNNDRNARNRDPLSSSSRTKSCQRAATAVSAISTNAAVAANTCDHVEPHRGDVNKFWLGPFQSLCKECHDSAKRFIEQRGYRPDVGPDGWPLDPNHPCYARGR